MTATLTFKSRNLAKDFGIAWTRKTTRGRDESKTKPDGSVDVTVYDPNELEVKWIEEYVQAIND